ncbi:hypothetical protein NSK_005147 [Nannochloropsis salina CCMP1776]|uniref:Conserved oligomeric Golgi complex subunit 7 n=1 Tax=Nannochloropsis salina CCMP1776 TaxID=1027361 RepID=A0A4D9CW75_9STRA|nr:hypothetical protein NSK_005147 [Nannochloropsis salina CCMP1776]|eukprot:TFJ83551.1 hypothetical protein NSK_005147 [Nannochloropsis salina CCMP1776]
MDLAPFSQPTFDARAWVESILTPEKRDGETLDAYVSAVSMQLQLLAQELNGELERGMMELTGSLPRAMTELCLLETSGRSLEQELGHVLAQAVKAQDGREGGGEGRAEDEDPVQILAQLHKVKLNMSLCRDTLMEAAHWQRTVREVTERFAEGALGQTEERTQVLEQLEAQLEVLHTDTQYLLTVFENLALPPHPLLAHLFKVTSLTGEEEREGGKEGGVDAMQLKLSEKVAALRGASQGGGVGGREGREGRRGSRGRKGGLRVRAGRRMMQGATTGWNR